MSKSILYGLLAMAGFAALTLFVLIPLFALVPGDPFTMSFHLYTYGGITLLCGVIVACTHIIVAKLNVLLDKNKEETKENKDEH